MTGKKAKNKIELVDVLVILLRIAVIGAAVGLFVAAVNPARLSGMISKNTSLFTSVSSYSGLKSGFTRALSRGWIEEGTLLTTYIASLITIIGTVVMVAGVCMSLGKIKLKKLGVLLCSIGSVVGFVGMILFVVAHEGFVASSEPGRIEPMFSIGIFLYFAVFAITLLISIGSLIKLPKPTKEDKYEMSPSYKLFLMISPFIILVFLFSYLPLWGWRYAFYDFKPGFDLTSENFTGFKWFTFLFQNSATRNDIMRVLKNTLGMSGIGIATSWLPMVFAIFLSEMTSNKTRRVVQTFTTIPNFISWVLVYSVAFALFSTEGFVNSMLISLGIIEQGSNFLMNGNNLWLKMWLWGSWKGLGWGAIIYIAAISGIDQQLYEAATVDGAGRFKKMWHITVPGLIPTYCVLLLMSVAGILSNGMDQYFVFKNAITKDSIEVLDLYVYMLGLGSGNSNIPLATVVSMCKSIVSIVLLFIANNVAKLIRGDSIV